MELWANQVRSRGINFDSVNQGDRLIFEQLRVLNESYAALDSYFFTAGSSPLRAFELLCELVGRMAIFTPQRRVETVPSYDHDALGTSFWGIKRLVDAALDVVVEPDYQERAFVGAGQRLQVALESTWLQTNYRMYVAVTSSLTSDENRILVQRRLDMKIGSGSNVDEIYRFGRAGLRFEPISNPPRCLPLRPGRVFFSLDSSGSDDQWNHVRKELNLAIRFNESLISGGVQGQQSISIQIDGRPATLEFVLYAVPSSAV